MILRRACAMALVVLCAASCGKDDAAPKGGQAAASGSAAKAPPPQAMSASPSPAGGADAKAANDFPAPTGAWEMKPFVVGQWIRVALTSGSEPPIDHLFKIIGQEGAAFWLEVEAKAPAGTTVTQVLIDDSVRKGYRPGFVKKARVKPANGPVQEFTGAMLATVAGVVDQYLGTLDQADLAKAPRADATVPAGTFHGCYVRETDKPVMGIPVKSKTWHHPSVPVMGFVRSEDVSAGKPNKMELLEMHETGAKSAI